MSRLDRHTLFIDEDATTTLGLRGHTERHRETPENVPVRRGKRLVSEPEKQPPTKRLPVRRTDADTPIPVISGSPWSHYTNRYKVRHWCLFAVGTDKSYDERLCMIRSVLGSKREQQREQQIQSIRQLCHPNIVRSIEIYSDSDKNLFLVSQMMETSLLHVCRAPEYPSEPQLSSILFQVLSGSEYLISNGLVHENVSCDGVLINLAGEVKISNIELCEQGGDINKFLDSFSRLAMMLMDKDRKPDATLGLSNFKRWSVEAVEMFTLAGSQPSLKELADHSFWQKRKKEELVWLVHFTLISAYHNMT